MMKWMFWLKWMFWRGVIGVARFAKKHVFRQPLRWERNHTMLSVGDDSHGVQL